MKLGPARCVGFMFMGRVNATCRQPAHSAVVSLDRGDERREGTSADSDFLNFPEQLVQYSARLACFDGLI
jgi:hypothetical protein